MWRHEAPESRRAKSHWRAPRSAAQQHVLQENQHMNHAFVAETPAVPEITQAPAGVIAAWKVHAVTSRGRTRALAGELVQSLCSIEQQLVP